MKVLMFAVLAMVLAGQNLFAKNLPNSSEDFLNACSQAEDCDIRFFKEIAKTYRPSKEEDELRGYVLNVKSAAEKQFWHQNLETVQDPFGNVLIRLPATGSFSSKNLPSFALQSHLDMVLAYSEAKPGEDLRPYFKDGIVTEEKDGWIQSAGNRTTLGSDNGIGVAIMLKYLISPQLPHPALELIFTVQEEIGLVGAFNSQLPIKSGKMICLDGMTPEPGYIIAGAQGSISNTITAKLKTTESIDPCSDMILQITLTKLAGGHSGGDIYRGRLNAIKAFASILEFTAAQVGEVGVKSVVAGNVGIMNQIPNILQAELVIRKDLATLDLQRQIQTFLHALVAKNEDDLKNALINVEFKEAASTGKYIASDYDFSHFIREAIKSAPNGVVRSDDQFFHKVATSSNLSYLEIKAADTGIGMNLGYMTRSFFFDDMKSVESETNAAFSSREDSWQNFLVTNKGIVKPWLEPDSSQLMRDILTKSGGVFSKKFFVNAGLEPSAFKVLMPNLQVVALGPLTLLAHTVFEKLKLDSVKPVTAGLQKIFAIE